jgi:phosphate transport system substrate-binding protein
MAKTPPFDRNWSQKAMRRLFSRPAFPLHFFHLFSGHVNSMKRNFFFQLLGMFAFLVSANVFCGTNSFAEGDAASQADAGKQLSMMLDRIAPYHPQDGVSGKAILSGSTTMQQLGQEWASKFKQYHPSVEFSRGPDSSTAALESLKNDPSAIVGVGRMISQSEFESLRNGNCKEPAVAVVGLEPIAILVSDKNPLTSVTPAQLQMLFAKADTPTTWGQVGVAGELSKATVRIHGRGENATSQNFIETTILSGKPCAALATTHKSQTEMLEQLANDSAGVAIGRLGQHAGVHALNLDINGKTVVASDQSFLNGEYPLVRPLTLVFDKNLLDNDSGLRREILNYVLSRQGQEEVLRAGFFPINPGFIAHQMATFSKSQLR